MPVQGITDLQIIDDPEEIKKQHSPGSKPFLRLKFSNGMEIDISTNLAEMIGGAGAGTRKRYESKR